MKSELREKKELSEKERLFIENQNHCALCNSELLINVARLTLPAYWLKKPTARNAKSKLALKIMAYSKTKYWL